MSGRVFCFAPLILLAACNPVVHGECTTNAECPDGTTCVQSDPHTTGICVAAQTTMPTDAGSCEPACGSAEQCVNGLCTSSEPAAVTVVSPAADTMFGAVTVQVSVTAHSPDGVTGIQVQLTDVEGVVQTVAAMPGTSADAYEATLNLAEASIMNGSYEIIAIMMANQAATTRSAPVSITVEKKGPTVIIEPISYGQGETSFLRSDTIVIQAEISDAYGILSSSGPQLTISGMPAVTGAVVSGDTYSFTFSGYSPPFAEVSGTVAFEVSAADTLGNTTTATGSFAMTRLKWTWTKPRDGTIGVAPTLAQGLIVVGSEDGYVYALDPTSGTEAWEVSLSTSGAYPVGHLTTGASNVYAALNDGHLVALNPATNAPGDRVLFECPLGSGPFGGPSLHQLNTGFALGQTEDALTGGAQQETLFAFTADGYVAMYRQSNLPGPPNAPQTCFQDSSALNAQNDASPPALVQDSLGTHLFFGDSEGSVHAMTIALQPGTSTQPEAYSMTADWTKSLGLPIHGGVAYGSLSAGTGIVAIRQDAVVDGLGLSGMFLWTPPPATLSGTVRSTPVIGATDIYLQDANGDLGIASQMTGTSAASPVATTSTLSSSSANAAPIATADGRVYFASGTQLFAVSPSGSIEWSFQPTQAGTSSTTDLDVVTSELDCEGTLYVVAADQEHALVHALITDSVTGLANSPWPRAFHDSHNTLNAATAVSADGTCAD